MFTWDADVVGYRERQSTEPMMLHRAGKRTVSREFWDRHSKWIKKKSVKIVEEKKLSKAHSVDFSLCDDNNLNI